MPRWLLALAIVTLYALHQDVWFWSSARPLVFGFIPIGLFYHVAFSVLVALLMGLLVTYAWPAHLEHPIDADEGPRDAGSTRGAR